MVRGASVVLAVIASVLLLTAPPAAAEEARFVGQQSLGGRGVELTLATSAFAAETKVRVFLPVDYDADPTRRWPVTYYLAGTNHDQRSFDEQYDGERLTRNFPSIVVVPRGDSGYWSDWFNSGAGGRPQYETFVVDQLLPLIDRTFRTTATRQGRAMMGESMGGYGTLMLAARHPDLFAAAASISGAVDSNTAAVSAAVSGSPLLQGGQVDAIYGPRATQEVRWRGHNPWDLAENLRTVDVQVRTANGILDPQLGEGPADAPGCALERGVHEASVSLHTRLDELGIPHEWRDYGPGCHSVPNFQRQINDSVARFTHVLGRAKDPQTIGHVAVEPAIDVWGWQVRSDPRRALEFLRLRDADRRGLTLSGSGSTTVTTPAFFAGTRAVAVIGAGAALQATPDAAGRLTFQVDLGPANAGQQYAPGTQTPVVTKKVQFRPSGAAATPIAATNDSDDALRSRPAAGQRLAATGSRMSFVWWATALLLGATVVARRRRAGRHVTDRGL